MIRTSSRRALAGVAGITALGATLFAAHAASAGNGAIHAEATIVGAPTAVDPAPVVGFAKFDEDGNGLVHVNVKTWDMPAGLHGMHVHAIGRCTSSNFVEAGGHFNPTGAAHGEHTHGEHAEHHAGDLPNLVVNDDGRGNGNTASAHFTLTHDFANSLFDDDGSAIVVHANVDDFTAGTNGPGNSGARIACGVIVES